MKPAPPNRQPRIAVIGGGPAGSFFTIWLRHLTPASDPSPEIVIFEPRRLDKTGPAGCNMCAGVIGDSLLDGLRSLGIELAEPVIQRRLAGCYLETRGGSVDLPTAEGNHLYSTFRGAGPLCALPAPDESLDWFLLSTALARGADREARHVTDLRLPEDPDGPFEIRCRDGFTMEADLIVGAFGVNTTLAATFEQLGFGYRAPATIHARQAEIPVDPDLMPEPVRGRMVILDVAWPSLRYVALTPKRAHITLTLIGQDPSREDLRKLLHSSALAEMLPPGWSPAPDLCCTCAPRLPITPALNPLRDRLVIIGDANTSRYLKNGIESSFNTSRWAAESIAAGHTSSAALREHYLSKCLAVYDRDNPYGRLLFRVHDFFARSPRIARAHILLARAEQSRPDRPKPLTEALLGTFTGSMPYRTIVRQAIGPHIEFRFLPILLTSLFGRDGLRPSQWPLQPAAREEPGSHE